MADPQSHPLVSTEWLAAHRDRPDLRLVDATYYLPMQNRNARAEYEARHIEGAVFFDIDDIADSDSPLPHMLPSPEKFASRLRRMGLGDGTRAIIYDAIGQMSAARAWWMFRIFGHRDVAVLDGGLPKWLAEGRPVTDAPTLVRERHFTARFDNTQIRNKDQILANIDSRREILIDARSPGRFAGTEAEIWPGRRGGHIPGARNVPYMQLLNPDQTYRTPEELRRIFAEAGIGRDRSVICSCGSGISACVLALGLALIGQRDVAVYDGSWAEWGLPGETPVATGS